MCADKERSTFRRHGIHVVAADADEPHGGQPGKFLLVMDYLTERIQAATTGSKMLLGSGDGADHPATETGMAVYPNL